MRGLSIILNKIGLTNFSQQRNVMELLSLANCYEKEVFQEDLKQAGFEVKMIERLVLSNPHLVLMDEIEEEEETKVLNWLLIVTKRIANSSFDWPDSRENELTIITNELTASLIKTINQKYDVVIVLGRTQTELDLQNKKIHSFLKEKKVSATSIHTPGKPADAKTILKNYIEIINNEINFVCDSSIPNVYKAVYFLAKTKNMLIVSDSDNLLIHMNEVQEFFQQNNTWFKPEFICIDSPTLSSHELVKQIHDAASMHDKSKNLSAFSYSQYLYDASASVGSYAFSMFYRPISLGGSVVTTIQPWLPGFRK